MADAPSMSMSAPPKKLREAPPYGLHPQFRQVYAESFSAGSEGFLLRIGVGSIAPEMGEHGTERRVVTDFEMLIDPPGGEYLVEIISKWLAEIRSPGDAGAKSKAHE